VAALPNIDTPTVLITAQFPGTDAQTVASTVTTPLERQFGQIPGLTQMTSSSGNESSEITLQFACSISVNFASQAAINAAAGFLPPMPTPPIYRLTNSADTPVLMLAPTSKTLRLHDGQLADRASRLTRVDRYARPLFVRSLPRLTAPSGSPRLERTTLGSCSIRRKIGAASRLSASPARVGRTPRKVRRSRLTPSSAPARRSAGSARVAPHG